MIFVKQGLRYPEALFVYGTKIKSILENLTMLSHDEINM